VLDQYGDHHGGVERRIEKDVGRCAIPPQSDQPVSFECRELA